MMQNKLINMLEDIKMDKYTSYSNYLDGTDVEKISTWYYTFVSNRVTDVEKIIDLIYELYIREDVDLKPYEDYKILTTYLADKYEFNCENFLDIYRSFRDLLFL